ncbi:hypothetical protein GCM10020358_30810 [Amorphoplanes nipponensis]|uniref:Uncharacterized protein n=1 Tax=Actinoplanes nipponensis TaxID=135950 RepID=A0A919JH09_9ACTN|nr:hypothetical protein [Actinoplanes nipponensis]GIE46614.1 hypothetical protein Ani05nite_01480 [Actinoplanes nipponensis]
MALRRQAGRFSWSAARRRRVLERAEREQARERDAARERLLHDAARAGDHERRPARPRTAAPAVRVVCPV